SYSLAGPVSYPPAISPYAAPIPLPFLPPEWLAKSNTGLQRLYPAVGLGKNAPARKVKRPEAGKSHVIAALSRLCRLVFHRRDHSRADHHADRRQQPAPWHASGIAERGG